MPKTLGLVKYYRYFCVLNIGSNYELNRIKCVLVEKAMAQLFGVDKSGISRHISNIYKTDELQPDASVAKIATVVNRGIRGNVEELMDFTISI